MLLISLCLSGVLLAQQPTGLSPLDSQVSRFLEEARNTWSDMNVPYQDGKTLYSLVLKGRFKNILEIGTSTGHSTIWLAWAASKTGGRVTTIEIDRERYEKALANFKKAGVASYIDARLADAHQLVPRLQGPYDFIFCDADKDWYLQYFLDLEAKISPRGCFTAHNVLWRHDPHIKKFLDSSQRKPGIPNPYRKGQRRGHLRQLPDRKIGKEKEADFTTYRPIKVIINTAMSQKKISWSKYLSVTFRLFFQ